MARRHAETYVALVEEAAPHLLGPEGLAWNDRIEREHDNLRSRAALDRALGRGRARAAHDRGHVALLAGPGAPPGGPRAGARGARPAVGACPGCRRCDHGPRPPPAASPTGSAGRSPRTAPTAPPSRRRGRPAIASSSPMPSTTSASPHRPTRVSQLKRYRQGRPWFEERLALYRELDDRPGIASATWALSMALAADGDQEEAARAASGRASQRGCPPRE